MYTYTTQLATYGTAAHTQLLSLPHHPATQKPCSSVATVITRILRRLSSCSDHTPTHQWLPLSHVTHHGCSITCTSGKSCRGAPQALPHSGSCTTPKHPAGQLCTCMGLAVFIWGQLLAVFIWGQLYLYMGPQQRLHVCWLLRLPA